MWINDIHDRLVTTSSTGKHSTLKQKTAPQQQRKRGAVSMSRYTGSLTGCFLCVKCYGVSPYNPSAEPFLISIVNPAFVAFAVPLNVNVRSTRPKAVILSL